MWKSFDNLFDGTSIFGTSVYDWRPNTSTHESFRSSAIWQEIVTANKEQNETMLRLTRGNKIDGGK